MTVNKTATEVMKDMAMSTKKFHELAAAENVEAVKQRLKTMLPERVIKRISHVSEHYMVDRLTLALKVRFENGLWSPALHIDDRKFMLDMFGELKDQAINGTEFVAWCCMMCDAGEDSGDT